MPIGDVCERQDCPATECRIKRLTAERDSWLDRTISLESTVLGSPRTKDEIEALVGRIEGKDGARLSKTQFPDLDYEEGLLTLYYWLTGTVEDDPLEERVWTRMSQVRVKQEEEA